MASKPTIGSTGPELQTYLPPSARELRAQAVHRLQIGLLGLAGILLMIGLANIIMDRARLSDRAQLANPAAAAASPKSDPLADIGAVPSPEASTAAQRSALPPR